MANKKPALRSLLQRAKERKSDLDTAIDYQSRTGKSPKIGGAVRPKPLKKR